MRQAEELDDLLPSQPSEVSTDLGDYSILIYGMEKIGKTAFASQFPDALFIMFEPGGKAQQIYKKEPQTWTEFLKILQALEENRKRFKTIVIDTVDIAFKMAENYTLKKLGVLHQSDENYGKGWTMVKDEFARAMNKVLKLGRGVIFTSHTTEKEIRRRSGESITRTVPTMNKQARDVIEPMVDIWCHMQYTDAGGREIVLKGGTDIAAGNRLEEQFFKGVDAVPMGKSPKEAYQNFVRAFNNENTAVSVSQKPKLMPRRK